MSCFSHVGVKTGVAMTRFITQTLDLMTVGRERVIRDSAARLLSRIVPYLDQLG